MTSTAPLETDAGDKARDVLRRFNFERVLSEDPRNKSINILGTVLPPSTSDPSAPAEPAILCVEKVHFAESEIPNLASNGLDEIHVRDSNDIYTWINATLEKQERSSKKRQKTEVKGDESGLATSAAEDTFSPDVKVYLIYPATDLHIRKYTVQPRVLVRETPDLYSSVTLPYIKSIPDKRTAWVQNILDGLKEQDSVVLADSDPFNGFVLVPDSKWDRRRMEELYLQVLCRNPAIGSLRDLRAEHLPLLKGIREKVGIRIEELYEGVKREHLRMFIHYQPSYYRSHVHITHVRVSEGSGAFVAQAHLLEDVIANLEMDSEYYAKRTLIYVLGTETDLYGRFVASGEVFLNGSEE